MRSLLALLSTLVLVAVTHGQSQVHVVAPAAGGGVDFVTLQAAVDAAVTGDVILVRPGTYTAGCTISSKSVHLLADDPMGAGTRPLVEAPEPLVVSSTPAGTTTVVRGLELRGTARPDGYVPGAVLISDADGAVLFEECEVATVGGIGGTGTRPALVTSDCAGGVALRDCTLFGMDGFTAQVGPFGGPIAGSAGLFASATTVHAHRCWIEGGAGAGSFGGGSGTDGAPSVLARDGARTSLHGCTLVGGEGGPTTNLVGEAGGSCVAGVTGSASSPDWTGPLLLQDCTLVPGPGGIGVNGAGPTGTPLGTSVTDVTYAAGVARGYAIEAPRRVGRTATLRFDGEAGDLAFLFTGRALHLVPILAAELPLALAFPNVHPTSVQVTLPGSGFVELAVPMPTIGGDEARWSFEQALFVTATGLELSSPSAAVVLDPTF